jgi:hypothetical protein
MTRQEFLYELSELYIGEWENSFVNWGICDGTEWHLTFTYDDGSQRKYSGRNMFPYNYKELKGLMKM